MPHLEIDNKLINLDQYDYIDFGITTVTFIKHMEYNNYGYDPKDARLTIRLDSTEELLRIKKEIIRLQNDDLTKKSKDKLRKLEKKIKELENAILYQPGGKGYLDAKQDFEEKVNIN